ncbi:hypothetical protein AB0L13_21240, partial [Saccharopolyspora shandongensis]|uniref:hypothetical protein n=1 Tax=Saccharopolyspora shandongensis TaxID=418495 RepID=UPI0034455095
VVSGHGRHSSHDHSRPRTQAFRVEDEKRSMEIGPSISIEIALEFTRSDVADLGERFELTSSSQ